MKRYTVRLSPEAQADLVDIHAYVAGHSGSIVTADRYIERIGGFERNVSVAFAVEDADVITLRLLAGGRELAENE